MTTPQRDVLAELDSVRAYLEELIGEEPLAGQDSNLKRLDSVYDGLYSLAENVVQLAAEYGSGLTHAHRVASSTGYDPEGLLAGNKDKEIADLRAQLAAAQSGGPQDG